MPFTFAHPAAAVPLGRFRGRHGSVSALVIGSMVPDLPFFLGVLIPRTQTHSISGLILWALPAGIVLYALFHAFLKDALIALAPNAVQGRMSSASHTGRAGLFAIVVSLLAGAATHILWDSFTHPGTIVVLSLPVLQSSLGRIGAYELSIFKLLQHLGSLVGLSLLAFWSWRWFRRASVCAAPPVLMPLSVRRGICTVLIIAPLLAGGWAAWSSETSASRLPDFVFTALPVFFWMLTAFALAWPIARRKILSEATET